VTITNGSALYYTPVATTLSADGISRTNNDNRFQTVTLAVAGTTGIKAGDAFTIAGVNEVHHITKADTGSLKTFRIVSQATGTAGQTGTYVITPPIISGTGGTDPELQYKNVLTAPDNGAVDHLAQHGLGCGQPVLAGRCVRDHAGAVRARSRCRLAVTRPRPTAALRS
jgi:hypothetical protein